MDDETKLRILAIINEIGVVADSIERTHEDLSFINPAKQRRLQAQALRQQVNELLKLMEVA